MNGSASLALACEEIEKVLTLSALSLLGHPNTDVQIYFSPFSSFEP